MVGESERYHVRLGRDRATVIDTVRRLEGPVFTGEDRLMRACAAMERLNDQVLAGLSPAEFLTQELPAFARRQRQISAVREVETAALRAVSEASRLLAEATALIRRLEAEQASEVAPGGSDGFAPQNGSERAGA